MAEQPATQPTKRVVVGNSLELVLRPVRPDDKRLLAQAFERLSPETRYRRFFAPVERLSERDLRYLTEVDHHDHEALAAINPENGMIVGVARYIRSDQPSEAEVAVVVGDPWQGQGVATALLQELVRRAREEGIDHFVALVMSDNTEALDLFRHLAPGGSHVRRSASGHTELVMALPEPERIGESTLGRALRAAAAGVRMNPWSTLRERIVGVADRMARRR
jgi:RimJ/RimL family protein N-acetyltransferase